MGNFPQALSQLGFCDKFKLASAKIWNNFRNLCNIFCYIFYEGKDHGVLPLNEFGKSITELCTSNSNTIYLIIVYNIQSNCALQLSFD